MSNRRLHRRVKETSFIRLRHPSFGMAVGTLSNMSEGGVLVKQLRIEDFCIGMEVEADIIRQFWDADLPSLTMRVVRVTASTVALVFKGAVDYLPEEEEPPFAYSDDFYRDAPY